MSKEIHESDPISIPEVRQLLLDRAKEGEELSYMQRIALEHATLTSRVSSDVARRLIDEFMAKFSLTKKGAITLANFLPNTVDEIKVLLGKEAGNFEQETFEEMLNILLQADTLTEDERAQDLMELDEEEEEEEDLDDKEMDDSMIPEDLR
ncbi:MAG: hypothetical protein ACXAE3_02585 [Candidatus Kariarchaeaceae archaeon]|jgi:DNA-directed RNA polymerase subunit F